MNKTDFINAVSAKAGLSKADTKKAVDAFIETVAEELKIGGKVSLLGFGAFTIAEKAARQGINPKTKEAIEISARKAIKFKAGAELNDLVK
ncbi:MAG: HU family DNA-binding protein [Tannerellaceae bacterium]